jgi:tetratricopeptide (TPR) repeat protein
MAMYLLMFMGLYLAYYLSGKRESDSANSIPNGAEVHINRLWNEAVQSLRLNRFIRAEKALLAMLHIDEHNVAAYNRLGVLYARQKNFKDSLHCFEIAYGLKPNASSIHNAGLIYLEIEKYDKAISAFERAIEIEPGIPSRYLALAKAYDKKGDKNKTIATLEKVTEVKPDKQTFGLLIQAYEAAGMSDEANNMRAKFKRTIYKPSAQHSLKQPRRIV